MNRPRSPRALLPFLVLPVLACSDEPPPTAPPDAAFAAAPVSCVFKGSNNLKKLTDCVTLDGVRAHQAAFQAIADANGGTRAAGTPGHDASVAYVAARLEDAGYDVTLEEFQFDQFRVLASALIRLAPVVSPYLVGTDYNVMDRSASGDVTAAVTAVDLQLGLGNVATSGCEAADFAGFTPGTIALIQRGTCTFELKAENAAAAGAIGVIIFNQGNTPDRTGLFTGTLGAAYTGGIPVVSAPYALGVEWAATPGLQMRLFVNAVFGTFTTHNVIAETDGGDPGQVVLAGGHLDSVLGGPGINDNGSGAAALLETAVQMAGVKTRNRVRFAWWSGVEVSQPGSIRYLADLTADELDDIVLYLNVDIVGSPNYVRFVLDGDGSDGGPAGPPGSGVIEGVLGGLYAERGLSYEATTLDFASDHVPFAQAGIPVGGITTGRDGIKTAAQAAEYGGTAGIAYDPCYHQACDTYGNASLEVLDLNADIVASAVLTFGMNAGAVSGQKGKGNFKPPVVDAASSLATR